jgi:hypothetical protein
MPRVRSSVSFGGFMLAHHYLRASARRVRRILCGFGPTWLCLLLLAGCTAAPPAPVTGAHPANPDTHARPTAYRPVIGPYASQRPRDPSGWRQNNERVAPREKP